MNGLRSRLRRLELASRPEQQIVATIGRTEEEHDRQVAALIAAGEAHETDLFVCVTKFSEDELREDECPRISSSGERRLIPLGALSWA